MLNDGADLEALAITIRSACHRDSRQLRAASPGDIVRS